MPSHLGSDDRRVGGEFRRHAGLIFGLGLEGVQGTRDSLCPLMPGDMEQPIALMYQRQVGPADEYALHRALHAQFIGPERIGDQAQKLALGDLSAQGDDGAQHAPTCWTG